MADRKPTGVLAVVVAMVVLAASTVLGATIPLQWAIPLAVFGGMGAFAWTGLRLAKAVA